MFNESVVVFVYEVLVGTKITWTKLLYPTASCSLSVIGDAAKYQTFSFFID